ncbi:MAG: Eco57I restriction-modification methylase domain-containing protein [Eggerthellaceae bacterium]|nr:Eco57I restriction-modification methylase domain-containing protein [Eggerthellaceae bacterium]
MSRIRVRDLASLASASSLFAASAIEKLERLQAMLKPLAARYDVVVANPPYMGSSNMNKWLADWTKRAYPDSKRDLCTCFIERGQNLAIDRGYEALITSDTCMYISSFEQLRKNILSRSTIVCFIDTRGTNAHPDVFDANAGWVLHNAFVEGVKGSYFKLNQAITAKDAGYLEALANPDCGWVYERPSSSFDSIPGTPIAYWLSEKFVQAFNWPSIGASIDSSTGMKTGDNEQFLRHWWEVSQTLFNADAMSLADSITSNAKWFPYNKGGDFRKWYGNNDEVINWRNNGEDIKTPPEEGVRHFQLIKDEWMFATHVTWTKICSSDTSFRLKERGHLFDMAGASLIPASRDKSLEVLAFCNSSVAKLLLRVLAPTLNYQSGDIANLPLAENCHRDRVVSLADDSVRVSKEDWDSYEESWDFSHHPLV